MRRTDSPFLVPGRWRRRRAARIGLALALLAAAPFVDGSRTTVPGPAAPDPTGPDTTLPAAATAGPHDSAREPVRVVPVPLADPTLGDHLRPGDLVDLVSTADPAEPRPGGAGGSDDPAGTGPGHPPTVVAGGARVRDAPEGRAGSRSLLVEVPAADAVRLAATAATTPLAVVLHR